jgi:hypothetical protein
MSRDKTSQIKGKNLIKKAISPHTQCSYGPHKSLAKASALNNRNRNSETPNKKRSKKKREEKRKKKNEIRGGKNLKKKKQRHELASPFSP